MAKKVMVSVAGLRDLEAALRELPKAAGKATLRRVGVAALKGFDDKWRALAPELTGSLKRSGGVGTRLTKRQAKQARRDPDGKASVTIYAGPNDPAAIQAEFGNAHAGATPFGRPAWDTEKDGALAHVATELGNEIEKTRARVARKAARLAARNGGGS